jgi:DNA adenine methylase
MPPRTRAPAKRESPRPFLKWAGGKRELLPEILNDLPEGRLDLYIEPFLGGGAVFCELARLGRIGRAVLGDRNPELVDTWRAVQSQPEALHAAFGQWGTSEAEYYAVRALAPAALSPLDRAARVLYLNRRGFNGLYRLNRSGEFNVPFGRFATPPRLDLDNLLAVHRALQGVELVQGDFDAVLEHVAPGATVYCDPPYWPASATSNFNFYDGCVFGPVEQRRLAETFRGLAGRGARGLLSNSDVPATRDLYAGLRLRAVLCRRRINSKVDARGHVSELLVRTGG